jgi:hypothetical protein
MKTEVIHNGFNLHNFITLNTYWPQHCAATKKTQLKPVGEGGRDISGGGADALHVWRRCKCIKILEAVQVYGGGADALHFWRRCRCMVAVHMYQNSGGVAGALHVWRRCKCIEILGAVQVYGGGASVLKFWRRCRCIKILAVLQFLSLVQMR